MGKKKEYAPLVSEEVYKYQEEIEKKAFRLNRHADQDNVSYVILCPECGHLHIVKDRGKVTHRYLSKFLCPKCGFRGPTRESYKWEEPSSAHIFHMADGSCAVTLLIKIHTLFIAMDHKTPMHVIRTIRARYVFNANGHTYFKTPVYIDTNRPLIKGYRKLITITYRSNGFGKCYYPMYNDLMQELEEKGFLPQNAVAKNRFKNLSEKIVYALYQLLNIADRKQSYTGRKVAATVRLIKREATDEDILRTLIQESGLKGGKKFRRMMAENLKETFLQSIWFRALKMKDINSFYKISAGVKYYFVDKDSSTFILAQKIINNYGENVFADMLSSRDKSSMFIDTAFAIDRLKEYMPEEEIHPLICRNLRTMHDGLVKALDETRKQVRAGKDIPSLLKKNEELEAGRIDKPLISIVKNTIINTAEEITNNPIVYGEEERKLEEEIDNVTFYLPEDTDHLKSAGDRLHNCVGHLYRMKAYRKKCIIVLMKQEDKFVGCIEICDGIIRQAYGPCNNPFSEAAQRSFNQWIKQHQLSTEKTNALLSDVSKEYKQPKFEDVIQKLKTAAANMPTNTQVRIECRNRVRNQFRPLNVPF